MTIHMALSISINVSTASQDAEVWWSETSLNAATFSLTHSNIIVLVFSLGRCRVGVTLYNKSVADHLPRNIHTVQ